MLEHLAPVIGLLIAIFGVIGGRRISSWWADQRQRTTEREEAARRIETAFDAALEDARRADRIAELEAEIHAADEAADAAIPDQPADPGELSDPALDHRFSEALNRWR